jgi:hypothetical protein
MQLSLNVHGCPTSIPPAEQSSVISWALLVIMILKRWATPSNRDPGRISKLDIQQENILQVHVTPLVRLVQTRLSGTIKLIHPRLLANR